MLDNLKTKLKNFEELLWKQSENLGFGKWFLIRLIRVTYLVALKIPKERPMLRSAALTYTSTLSLLPMLAMLFGLLGVFDQAAKEKAIDYMFKQFEGMVAVQNVGGSEVSEKAAGSEEVDMVETQTPVANNDMYAKVKAMVIKSIDDVSSGGKLSGISLLVFLLGALTLLSNIERAFNDIWGIENLRPIKLRIMSYVFILVTLPVVVLISFTILAASNIDLTEYSWIPHALANFFQSGFQFVLPYMLWIIFFTTLYLVMPNVQVKFSSALAGGIVSGIFFESNKLIAALMLSKFTTINKAYGSLALIPIFLICCMVAWLIVLLGAHVASAWGNVEGYRREFLSSRQDTGYDETIALRLVLKIADRFRVNGEATDYEVAGEEWALPNAKLRNLLDKLELCGLVHHLGAKETKYVPGRELDRISVVDVLSAVRFGKDGWQPIPDGADSSRINNLVQRIRDAEDEKLKDLTIDKLLNESA